MLDTRSQLLLKTLVERYIIEGEPVGSRTLSRASGLDLSPATIRNVMADLEDLGFVSSPHTSAGRIPTPKGYRFFVDTLLTVQPLDDVEIRQMESGLKEHDPQKLATQASLLLSQLTHFAGVVVTPKRSGTKLRQLEFLKLSANRVLMILVSQDGSVQNRILPTERDFTQSQLVEAGNFFNMHYSGHSIGEVREFLSKELQALQSDMTSLMKLALEAGQDAISESDDYVISGTSSLLKVPDWSANMNHIRKLFDAFEKKTELLMLLEVSQRVTGVQIFIGGESGVMPLDECSMVTASYEANGQVVGTVGVIGPTRMAYHRIIPIVDITARLLASALSDRG
ncbi:MAG: heat-inducible transcriptional repressor HrcA [Pseudomonadota bacterium]|nr:heat-inducible transcriptional repressor HrcA [Pseudomonadota bacterium]